MIPGHFLPEHYPYNNENKQNLIHKFIDTYMKKNKFMEK